MPQRNKGVKTILPNLVFVFPFRPLESSNDDCKISLTPNTTSRLEAIRSADDRCDGPAQPLLSSTLVTSRQALYRNGHHACAHVWFGWPTLGFQ